LLDLSSKLLYNLLVNKAAAVDCQTGDVTPLPGGIRPAALNLGRMFMCLTEIISTKLSKKEQSGIGWKAFRADEYYPGRLTFEFLRHTSYSTIPINRWMHAEYWGVEYNLWSDTEHIYVPQFSYLSGFHIFKTRAEARRWAGNCCKYLLRVRKVKYRNARILGRQNAYNVIVADKILVVKK
jgi:hypothetical protein